MGETLLFCFVFLSQVLLISRLYPRRVISRVRYVLRNFPPSTHPRLYPNPPEHYERWLRNLARLDLAIVVAGLVIIGLILVTFAGGSDGVVFAYSRHKDWDTFIVTPFFVVQLFALVGYINLSGRKFLQAMAKAPPPRVRTAELNRRRLVDFVPPAMLVVAAVTNVAFIAFVLYYRRFEFPWFTAAGNIAGVAVMLLVFSVGVGTILRASRFDPYQAHRDRLEMIKVVVRQALTFSIALPVLITAQLIIKLFDASSFEPVIASLFVQGCALALLWPTYRYRVDNVDFDVYRGDARDSTPDASTTITPY